VRRTCYRNPQPEETTEIGEPAYVLHAMHRVGAASSKCIRVCRIGLRDIAKQLDLIDMRTNLVYVFIWFRDVANLPGQYTSMAQGHSASLLFASLLFYLISPNVTVLACNALDDDASGSFPFE
jgi:hypothetical protein